LRQIKARPAGLFDKLAWVCAIRGQNMSTRNVVLCAPVRTAIGTYGGALKDTPAPELGAAAIRESLSRAGLDGQDVGTVVMGNVIQAGVKMNPARQAAIGGGIPVEVPAMTPSRATTSAVATSTRTAG
jgi:acetyl-CoA C-acetyltransferase